VGVARGGRPRVTTLPLCCLIVLGILAGSARTFSRVVGGLMMHQCLRLGLVQEQQVRRNPCHDAEPVLPWNHRPVDASEEAVVGHVVVDEAAVLEEGTKEEHHVGVADAADHVLLKLQPPLRCVGAEHLDGDGVWSRWPLFMGFSSKRGPSSWTAPMRVVERSLTPRRLETGSMSKAESSRSQAGSRGANTGGAEEERSRRVRRGGRQRTRDWSRCAEERT
jgi:hypothetical protein